MQRIKSIPLNSACVHLFLNLLQVHAPFLLVHMSMTMINLLTPIPIKEPSPACLTTHCPVLSTKTPQKNISSTMDVHVLVCWDSAELNVISSQNTFKEWFLTKSNDKYTIIIHRFSLTKGPTSRGKLFSCNYGNWLPAVYKAEPALPILIETGKHNTI